MTWEKKIKHTQHFLFLLLEETQGMLLLLLLDLISKLN